MCESLLQLFEMIDANDRMGVSRESTQLCFRRMQFKAVLAIRPSLYDNISFNFKVPFLKSDVYGALLIFAAIQGNMPAGLPAYFGHSRHHAESRKLRSNQNHVGSCRQFAEF